MGLLDIFKQKEKAAVYDPQMVVLFCFTRHTFTCRQMLEFMEQSGDFTPALVSRADIYAPLSKETLNEISNADAESNEILWNTGLYFKDSDNKRHVYFHSFSNRGKFQAIYWQFKSMAFLESPVFKKMIGHNNLVAAFCYNVEDDAMQNMPFLHIYKEKGIKPIGTRKNSLGQLEVDIYKNPGKSYIGKYTWLKSSWKMWFGKIFYNIVSKEKIHGFKEALSIDVVDNDVTLVQLYDSPKDFDKKENRKIQLSFRKWMEYEKMDDTPPR